MIEHLKRYGRLIRYGKLCEIEHNRRILPVCIIIFLSITIIIGGFGYITSQELNVSDVFLVVAQNLIAIITMGATLYMCAQIKLMKDINHTEMSHEIYEDNVEYRLKAGDAIKLLEKLDGIIANYSDKQLTKENIKALYNEEEYKVLREFAYHYEYLGYMLQRECVDFPLLFNTLTFPDALIKQSENLRKKGRAFYLDDLWNGAEYLYRTYEVKRKYNKWRRLNRFCRKIGKFTECPEDNCKSLKNCSENSAKIKQCLKTKRKEAMKDLQIAEKEWIKFYKKLPE